MIINGQEHRTVEMDMQTGTVYMIEQNLLPFEFKKIASKTYKETAEHIRIMTVRGAGAIGGTAAYAMAQAVLEAPENGFMDFVTQAKQFIEATRPTAQNLFEATNRVFAKAKISKKAALVEAQEVNDKDVRDAKKIGEFGNALIKDGFRIETHCNAGSLAFVDIGTALSPIYKAHQQGKKVFVYADETGPRNQGGRLTGWELEQAGVPHTIIPDNAGAFYMSQGKVDIMIVGADRIAVNGDTANKIGTLEKAIVAKYYGVPFYVAAPFSTIDFECTTGEQIPIEFRSQTEVTHKSGVDENGEHSTILTLNPGSTAENPAFDVTPAELITGFITEKGILQPYEFIF